MKALHRYALTCLVIALLLLQGAGSAQAWGAPGTFLDYLESAQTQAPKATATPTPKPTATATATAAATKATATPAPTATPKATATVSAAPATPTKAPATPGKQAEGDYTVLYQITFYTLGGSMLHTQHLSSDSILQAMDAPYETGLTFVEWVDAENPDSPVLFDTAPTRSMQLIPRYSIDDVIVPSFEDADESITSILDLVSAGGSTPAPATTEEEPISFDDLFAQGSEEEEEEEVDLFGALTSSILGTFESDDTTEEDILNIAASGMLEAGDYNLFKGDEAFTFDDDSMVSTRSLDNTITPPPIATVSRARMEQDGGDVMVLRVTISNLPEGIEASYQWRWDDGEGFVDIEDATSDMYTLDAQEAEAYAWDVMVYLMPVL